MCGDIFAIENPTSDAFIDDVALYSSTKSLRSLKGKVNFRKSYLNFEDDRSTHMTTSLSSSSAEDSVDMFERRVNTRSYGVLKM